MADDVWILGIHMTKFGKHPDKDTLDLASEAALNALADAGVTMKDIGVLAAGNLMGGAGGIGQNLQKQIGQTGIPVYNVANACATGATALRTAVMSVKAGESRLRPRRRSREAGRRRPARRRQPQAGRQDLDAHGPLRRGRGDRRADRHRDHARRLRPDRHGVRPPLRGDELRAVRPHQREEPRPLHAQPAGGVHEADDARGDHGRRDDRLPQHPSDVLGQLRRGGGRRGGVGIQAEDPVAGAAAAGGQDRRLRPDHRPVGRGVPGAAQRQHPHPQRGRAGV